MCLILFLALWRKIIVCPLSKLKFLCTKKLFCKILVDAQINFLSKIVIGENRKLSWSRFSTSWRKNMLSRKDLFFAKSSFFYAKTWQRIYQKCHKTDFVTCCCCLYNSTQQESTPGPSLQNTLNIHDIW